MEQDKKTIKFMDTTLRDGQQSLIATRMRTEEMTPILEQMDNAGFYSAEVWGGATFDAALRFLKEDPWERLRLFRKHLKKTKLQMLFRGQNMLGYKCCPDDAVEAFIDKAIYNGIDIIRVFDALNDIRNIESSVAAIKKNKAHAQLAIAYTTSEVHTIEYFISLAKQLEDMGADSICIKDMAGLLLPKTAYDLVIGIKKVCSVPIQIHSHYTSGAAAMSYLKAVEAGADIIDTATAPFAMGTSQPATEIMNETLKGFGYETDLNTEALNSISRFFKPIREAALKSGLLDPKVLEIDSFSLLYQVPGGMMSNLVSQLKMQKAEHRLNDVLKEIPAVRADLGYPPLVTPTSQIVGAQAVMNVLLGERYKAVSVEAKDLARGKYGKTPAPISDEIRKKLIGDEKPISVSPSKLLEPMLPEMEKKVERYKEQDEDVLSYALFPQAAEEFFKYRQAQKYGIDPSLADKQNSVYPI